MLPEEKVQTACETGEEIRVYLIIKSLLMLRRNVWHLHIEHLAEPYKATLTQGLKDLERQLAYAVEHTSRFGVQTPIDADGHMAVECWQWFLWWDRYYMDLSTDDRAMVPLHRALMEHRDVSGFRPDEDWRTVDLKGYHFKYE